MKNLKKVLALGLSATMVSSMFVTAGAAFTDQKDIKATDAVNMLSTLGVIDGYSDGSYKPETVVTRGEMAKMIFVVRNNKVDDSAYRNLSTKFADIKGHWAAGYIKFCESQGIIAGKTATKFDPDAPVTGVEAAKMLLVLTGYTPDTAGLTGHQWATNTLRWAAEAGILKDVNSALEQGLPRQYAAQEIYNTLDAYRVKWSKDSNSFDYFMTGGVKETVGRKYMGIYTVVGTMTEMNKDGFSLALKKAETDNDFPGITSSTADGSTLSFSKVTTDYSSLLGQKVKVLVKDGKTNSVLGVYSTSDNSAYTVAASGAEKDGDKVKFGGKSYAVELKGNDTTKDSGTNALVTYTDGNRDNGTTLSEIDSDDFKRTGNMYTFVDSDSNGKIDTLMIKKVKAAEVTYVSSSKVIANGKSYDVADNNVASGLVSGDWVVISKNPFKGTDYNDVVKADMLTGTIKGTKTNEYMIDSTWYKTAKADATINTVKAGDSVKAVNVNGVLYYLKRTSNATNGQLTDVAVVVRADDGIGGKQAKLQFFNDTTKVVSVDDSNLPTEGKLYAYTVSSDKYKFDGNINKDSDYYGDYTFKGAATGYDKGSDKLTVTGGSSEVIDDSAKVILYAGRDSKVITGKQFKSLTDAQLTGKADIQYFTAKVNGLTRVAALSIKLNALPTNITAANNYYGYIVSDAYVSASGEITYKIWNGSENVTVTEKKSNADDRKKNMLIGYKSLSDKKVIDDVTAYKVNDGTSFKVDAINGVNDSQSKVTFASDSAEMKVNSDTKVFYVDTDASSDSIGIAKATIKTANTWSNNNGGVEVGNKFANALRLGTGDTLDVLVFDVQNKLVGTYADQYKAVVTGKALTVTADTSVATPVYGTAGAARFNVTSKNIANDTTIALSAKMSGNDTEYAQKDANDAKISYTNDMKIGVDGKATINLVVGQSVPAGTYTLTFKTAEGDKIATTTATLTVNKKNAATWATPTTANVSGASVFGAGNTHKGKILAGKKLSEISSTAVQAGNATDYDSAVTVSVIGKVDNSDYVIAAFDAVTIKIVYTAKDAANVAMKTPTAAELTMAEVVPTVAVDGNKVTATYTFTGAAAVS